MNFIHLANPESDRELFFGPLAAEEPFLLFSTEDTLATLLVAINKFPSLTQARKNGWERPIPPGFTEHKIGKLKFWTLNFLEDLPMDPVRIALHQTIEGLMPQIPDWMPTTLIEHSDEDGEGGARRPETAPEHLRWMLAECETNLEHWPVDKTSRWIGYVQGVLAAKSQAFSVAAERDRTRPFFHEAYIATGYKVPETKDGPKGSGG